MRKSLGVLCIAMTLISQASAVQRVVVVEDFTGTNCPNCPQTANALHQLKQEAKDSIAVLSFHCGTGDPFNTTETLYRAQYFYGIPGTPTTVCDGVMPRIGSYAYATYRSDFNARKIIAPKMTIELTGAYNSSTRNGKIKAHVTNISSGSLTGVLHLIVVETNISYSWEGQSMLYDVVRDMLPVGGTPFTIGAGNSVDTSQNFLISSSGGWNPNNCSIVAFFQQTAKKAVEVYQGAEKSVMSIAVEENSNIKTQNAKIEISGNPVRQKASICYSLPAYANVKLVIYDISGEIVKKLVDNSQSAGNYNVNFDAKELSSGIYFAELEINGQKESKKFVLVK